MKARILAGAGVLTVLLAAGAWWLLERPVAGDGAAGSLLLPGLEARLESLDRLQVRGAGDQVLVEIVKTDGRWRMPARQDWPANQREISRALFRLSQARRQEAKTANPERHARLGVEAVAAADAKGAELQLSGGGEPLRLTIGRNHPSLGGSYARIGDEAQVWLLDVDVGPARNPVDWLDRRLLDLPLARVAEVRIAPAQGRAFRLTRAGDDRFSLDGQPSAALANPDDGNATAGVVEQLVLDDVAADSGAAAGQTAVFESVDGLRITIAAWRDDGGGTWARLAVELDEARAQAWFANEPVAPTMDAAAQSDATPDAGERLKSLRAKVERWQARFAGRQFLLPPQLAANLMKSREDYLAGSP
ncbi:DUF4340 domain-containing protein [Arenimonas terrae]|uniref:DUF4340 domain-containing protein n=1 Tax=Arenimonas terrae TaxID=2546226 RepID=A0A5C4RTQ9_9GAMM|nr:DUF4340 domain-containing protein [Arenimonas terrae]TNJ34352.1 DUF4340 domain-containing protein [Arenimonas terrae]